MFRLKWDPRIVDTPLYQLDDDIIDSARVFSWRNRDWGFRAEYARPPTIYDFRAEGLHHIDIPFTCRFESLAHRTNTWPNKRYYSTQNKQHGAHISDDTYDDFYDPLMEHDTRKTH